MAGDWIKVEHATRRKPEVLLAAEMLGVSRRESFGLFVDYFLWLDEALPAAFAGRDAVVTHMSRKSFDMVLDCPGFAATLEAIGWAKFDDDARKLTVINAAEHNGKAAKSRALARDRMKRSRDDSVTQTASPEKRREEKNKDNPPIPPKAEKQKNGHAISIVRFLDECKTKGEKPIADEDGIWAFTNAAKIPDELVRLHFRVFRDRYRDGDKRYTNWRAVIRRSIKANWYHVWRVNPDGEVVISQQGEILRAGLKGTDAAA